MRRHLPGGSACQHHICRHGKYLQLVVLPAAAVLWFYQSLKWGAAYCGNKKVLQRAQGRLLLLVLPEGQLCWLLLTSGRGRRLLQRRSTTAVP
jgi:hypothetical protein